MLSVIDPLLMNLQLKNLTMNPHIGYLTEEMRNTIVIISVVGVCTKLSLTLSLNDMSDYPIRAKYAELQCGSEM